MSLAIAIEEDDERRRQEEKVISDQYQRGSWGFFWYSVKVRVLIALSFHFSKIVLFYGLIMSVLHTSAAGVLACVL